MSLYFNNSRIKSFETKRKFERYSRTKHIQLFEYQTLFWIFYMYSYYVSTNTGSTFTTWIPAWYSGRTITGHILVFCIRHDHFNLDDIKILLIDEVEFFFPASEKQPGVPNFFFGKIFGSENKIMIFSVYRWFWFRSRSNLGLIIPNHKTYVHWWLWMRFISM